MVLGGGFQSTLVECLTIQGNACPPGMGSALTQISAFFLHWEALMPTHCPPPDQTQRFSAQNAQRDQRCGATGTCPLRCRGAPGSAGSTCRRGAPSGTQSPTPRRLRQRIRVAIPAGALRTQALPDHFLGSVSPSKRHQNTQKLPPNPHIVLVHLLG